MDRRVKENAYLRPGEPLPAWAVPALAPRVTVIPAVAPPVTPVVTPVVAPAIAPAVGAAPVVVPPEPAPGIAAALPIEQPRPAVDVPKDPVSPVVLGPSAPVDTPVDLPAGPPEAKVREKKHRPWGMAVATVALAGASGTTWYLARDAQSEFLTPVGSYPEDPEALQVRANMLGWTSVGTGAASLIFATATLVDW